jgi:pilus assembly protein Flp/PilA
MITDYLRDDEGASIVEYALLASLIALAVFVAISAVGGKLPAIFTTLSDKLTTSSS